MVTEEPTGRLGFPKAALSRRCRRRGIWIWTFGHSQTHAQTHLCMFAETNAHAQKAHAEELASARSLEQLWRSDGFLSLVSCRARGSGCWIISALMAPPCLCRPRPSACVKLLELPSRSCVKSCRVRSK